MIRSIIKSAALSIQNLDLEKEEYSLMKCKCPMDQTLKICFGDFSQDLLQIWLKMSFGTLITDKDQETFLKALKLLQASKRITLSQQKFLKVSKNLSCTP
jgi:hypothetical protein